jgi:hypothetical protein
MRETSVRLLIVASDLSRFMRHQCRGFRMLRIITLAIAQSAPVKGRQKYLHNCAQVTRMRAFRVTEFTRSSHGK